MLHIRLVDDVVHPIKDGFDVVFGTGPLQDSMLMARKVFSAFYAAACDIITESSARSEAVSRPMPSEARPTARTTPPTYTSAMSAFGRSRPAPMDEKKNPP